MGAIAKTKDPTAIFAAESTRTEDEGKPEREGRVAKHMPTLRQGMMRHVTLRLSV